MNSQRDNHQMNNYNAFESIDNFILDNMFYGNKKIKATFFLRSDFFSK